MTRLCLIDLEIFNGAVRMAGCLCAVRMLGCFSNSPFPPLRTPQSAPATNSPGLVSLVRRYIASLSLEPPVAAHIERYIQFVSDMSHTPLRITLLIASSPTAHRAVHPHIERYIQFVSDKAAGRIPTTAQWLRQYVTGHPAYQHDSLAARGLLGPYLDTLGVTPAAPNPHPHTGRLASISKWKGCGCPPTTSTTAAPDEKPAGGAAEIAAAKPTTEAAVVSSH
ncbi:hypothetical protein PAPYR_11497 [Paratrimastix pyriformis]|uniref:Glutamate--cysteine ligase n=1 Tax=Paratrimastix pyriformis TaxID=342808 RepID=A0ABQ8U3M7_9EUKA|nr:hypothetical protein PAPYR_11497 [Paratrimastix pyriformis]